MITNEQIKRIVNDCYEAGHTISVRDISYVLLCNQFDDHLVAYKSIFGNDVDYCQEYHDAYSQTSAITYLKTYIDLLPTNTAKRKTEDITFEENKEYMLKLKADTEKAMEEGQIEKKDGLKILTDISVKLNDKFKVASEEKDQIVQVFAKYNSICSYCGHEVSAAPMTKEEAMEKYNLIEIEQ